MTTEEEVEDFLEHYGVKGMKWGTRRQNRLSRAQRVGSGKGSTKDKLGFALTDTSSIAIARRGGLQGAAKARASELKGRKARIQKGKGNVRDFLALNGADRLVVTGANKQRTVSPRTKKKAAAGARFVANTYLNVNTMNKRAQRGPFQNLIRDIGGESKLMDNRTDQMAKDLATVFARKPGPKKK